jgi:uroporphyrinogen decarboxylase
MTALSHQEPDRVPLFAFAVDPKFIKALGGGNALKTFERLELDCFPLPLQSWCGDLPLMASLTRDIPEDYQTGGGIFAGWDGVDEFGRVWRRGSYVDGVLKSREDLEKYIPPLRLEERTHPKAVEKYRRLYPDKCLAVNLHVGPFGLTMESMGFTHFFYTLYDDRDLIREILERRTDWFISVCRHARELGGELVVMGDDVAFKGSTFVSPEDFRELALPCYIKITQALDIPVIWHSDGFVEPLLEMAVEAGMAGMHALEPLAGNDLERIKKNFGDRLVLVGNVDCAEVLTSTNLDLVRKDVDSCLKAAKQGGGFLLDSSNSLHAGCTIEAVAEMYHYGKEAGSY